MRQRMNATERRHQLLAVMNEIHQQAECQADFTAKKIAQTAEVSTVMFYRLVRTDFQTLRSQLPGPRRPRDEVIYALRIEIVNLRRQLREAKDKLRTTAVEELDQAMRVMEDLEKENLQLREEVKLLRKRLQEGGQVVIHMPTQGATRASLSVVNHGKDSKEMKEERNGL